MSVIATQVHSTLNDLFPANPHRRVFEEYHVNYKGQRLFFDFYLHEMSIFFECQGAQHFKFNKHFHGDVAGFRGQKFRDNLKIEYIQENGFYLVCINYNEEVTKDLILMKMNKAIDSEYGLCL